MVTRFYLPSTGAIDIPAVTPSASWTASTSYSALMAVRTKIASAMASHTYTNPSTAGTKYYLFHQYLSEPLKAQTIAGNIKGQIRCSETNAGLNATVAVCIRVVSPDGGTVRGTLLDVSASDLINADPSEFATSLKNRKLEDVNESASLALSSLAVQDGDRIVFELGIRRTGVTTSWTSSLSFGDDSANDLAEDMTTTTANNPWIEFDSNLTFWKFADQFESNNFNAWTGVVGGDETVQSTIKHHSSYAMSCPWYGQVHKNISAINTVYMRFYVYFDALPSTGNVVSIAELLLSGISDLIVMGVKNDGGTMKWGCTYPDNTYSATPNPTINTWYCVEVKFDYGNERRIYVNGVSVWSSTASSLQCDQVLLGRWDADYEIGVYADCVVVADAYIGPESTTYTKTFTFDGLLQKSLTKTFSFDGWFQKSLIKTFTFDALTKLVSSKTLTFDGLLQKTQIKTLTFDGLLQKTLTKPFTFDSLLQKLLTKNFTFDALTQKTQPKNFSFDSLLQKLGTENFTFDAHLQKTLTAIFTFDGVLITGGTASFTIDGWLQGNYPENFTFDGILFRQDTKTFTYDATVQKNLPKDFIFDGLLQKGGLSTFTFDGLLQKSGFNAFIYDALLQLKRDETFTFDAILQALLSGTEQFSFDANLQKTLLKNFTFDALLETLTTPVTAPSTGDAWFRRGNVPKPLPLSKEQLRLIRDYLRLKLE